MRPFSVRLSVEKEKSAHQTLSFRAFLRPFGACFPQEYYDWVNNGGAEPDWQALYPAQWKAAREEALCLTLGDETAARIITRPCPSTGLGHQSTWDLLFRIDTCPEGASSVANLCASSEGACRDLRSAGRVS